jgi:hypothetical protein
MPRRKETTRAKRLNEQVIECLREIVLSGTLWKKTVFFRRFEALGFFTARICGFWRLLLWRKPVYNAAI